VAIERRHDGYAGSMVRVARNAEICQEELSGPAAPESVFGKASVTVAVGVMACGDAVSRRRLSNLPSRREGQYAIVSTVPFSGSPPGVAMGECPFWTRWRMMNDCG
jgi:hypothetical protein